MTTRRLCTTAVAVVGAVAFLAVACGEPSQDGDLTEGQIESKLSQENGGYQMSDEAPGFGLAELLAIEDLQDVAKLISEIPEPPQGLDESTAPAGANASSSGSNAPNTSATGSNPQPVPPIKLCPGGAAKGRWHAYNKLGFWRGGLFDDAGKLVGWMRGIFGRGRFFGKVITRNGKFRALIAGAYDSGKFKGRMFAGNGVVAVIHGVYGKGWFKGRWITRCKQPCTILCAPGFRPDPNGACRCVPVACKPGSCPAGQYCDMCPSVCGPLASSDPNRPAAGSASGSSPLPCPAVCGTPICKPRPTPVPSPCVTTSLGDTTSCKSTDVWKKYAAGACQSRGLVLTKIDFGTPCGITTNSAGSANTAAGLFRTTKFQCCKPTTSCQDPAVYCKLLCNGQSAPPIAPGCPMPRCACQPTCPDPAAICKAACNGTTPPTVPPGCPIPGCNCPQPSTCPSATDVCRDVCAGTKPTLPSNCAMPACKCTNSAGTPTPTP